MPCATWCASMRWKRWLIPQAVLVIDEMGFLKQGRSSCGVGEIEMALRRGAAAMCWA